MSTFIDLHIVQNVAPSCLNRDDTGAPKDAMFGGYRRARVSSQCLKRAARLHFASSGLLSPDELAIRTRNIVTLISDRLAQLGHDDTTTAITAVLDAADLGVKARKAKGDEPAPAPQTEYLLFLANAVVDQLIQLIADNIDELSKGKATAALKKEIIGLMSSANAVDVAMFGRMVADKKDLGVDAAAQVAHAISANKIDRESDFFTAVDDWTAADEADAGMLGSVEFNSSCLYRFATINLDLLIKNLGGDRDLALKGLAAFLRSSVLAIPSGKQNTFAAHNLPAAVAIGVHNSQPISLANAIEKPVWHGEHANGLAAATVARLQQHATTLSNAYGLELGLQVMDTTGAWDGDTIAALDDLITTTIAAVQEGN